VKAVAGAHDAVLPPTPAPDSSRVRDDAFAHHKSNGEASALVLVRSSSEVQVVLASGTAGLCVGSAAVPAGRSRTTSALLVDREQKRTVLHSVQAIVLPVRGCSTDGWIESARPAENCLESNGGECGLPFELVHLIGVLATAPVAWSTLPCCNTSPKSMSSRATLANVA
jgi:hypothetical protein